MLLRQCTIALGGIKALRVPLRQVGRLKDRHIDVSVLENILQQILLEVLLEVLDRPVRLRRTQSLIGVETLDPALCVVLAALHPVFRTGVPVVHVAIDDEILLSVFLVHVSSSDVSSDGVATVSYTHLTLPTKRIV